MSPSMAAPHRQERIAGMHTMGFWKLLAVVLVYGCFAWGLVACAGTKMSHLFSCAEIGLPSWCRTTCSTYDTVPDLTSGDVPGWICVEGRNVGVRV